MTSNSITVRTHVGRDLFQSAALFKTDKLVVWEYVANGIQYVTPGVNPVVRVMLDSKAKEITITDNGRGMDVAGLRNFFLMHGENQDRKAGRHGRGRFGTGKSAAFGIADCLRVTSVCNGRRNSVELRRAEIERSGDREIPVKVLEREVPSTASNGTRIEIRGVRLRSLDHQGIVQFVERHLAHWPSKPLVMINNHECEYAEPPILKVERIPTQGETAKQLGNIELTLKVAKVPLDPDLQGVNVFAKEVWLETTLAGIEGQPMSQFIFGDIDVPALDDDRAPIPAYDMSRSMQLNRNNETVASLYAFIGAEIDKLRRGLVKED